MAKQRKDITKKSKDITKKSKEKKIRNLLLNILYRTKN